MDLKHAKIVGFVTRAQADGMCAHCSMGIKHCVIVVDPESGREVAIGTTCAERVGLDSAMVRRRETHAQREQRERIEAAKVALEGEKWATGTEGRMLKREAKAKRLWAFHDLLCKLRRSAFVHDKNYFLQSIYDRIKSGSTLSFRQAECVCKFNSASGRRNKKNAQEWDDLMERLTTEG